MHKILFVCHGNICRSSMAQCVMQHLVREAGMEDQFFIDSAAVSREEIGSPIYPPARRELQKHGIPDCGHRARQITQADCAKFDFIYYMDASNARYLARLFPGNTMFRPLLSHDVADPWYTGDFSATYEDVLQGCRRILEELSC